MRHHSRIMRVSAAGAALAVGIAVFAAHADERMAAHSGVTYVSGGVGVDAQERLNARAGEFNLKLVFTLVEGNYLADVNVVVTDAKGGKVIEHLADGPFFMARLPAGQYGVAATYDGKTVSRRVSVGPGGLRTEYFRWAGNPQADHPLPREQAEKTRPAAGQNRG